MEFARTRNRAAGKSVYGAMRPRRILLPAAGALFAAASFAVAQQQPVHGCNAAASCKPLGFSTIDKNAGFGGFFGGVGARWGPGFSVFIPAVKEISLTPPPEAAEIFHLNVSLLNPPPPPVLLPALAPVPAPTPAR